MRVWVKRAIPQPLEPLVRSFLTRYRLMRGPLRGRERALRAEVAFWERWLTQGGVKVEERLDSRLMDSAVVECVSRIAEKDVAIVDVGAGPLTTLGKEFPGKRIFLTATDPLAGEYERVLRKVGITPPVKTIPCAGEDLLEHFGPESFDIAFAENALDHAVDPLAILQNMFAVVRPGRFVVLNHFRNEGEQSSYGHLHHWNFDERGGRCWVWGEHEQHDLGNVFSGKAIIECRTERSPPGGKERVVCIIMKQNSAEASRSG
jgi:SAM-dependent methyltransferase